MTPEKAQALKAGITGAEMFEHGLKTFVANKDRREARWAMVVRLLQENGCNIRQTADGVWMVTETKAEVSL